MHDITENPQVDTEVIEYGLESIYKFSHGSFSEYYFQERKYPLLNNVLFGGFYYSLIDPIYYVTQENIYALQDQYQDIAIISLIHSIGRLYTVLFALGSLVLVQKISKLLFKKPDAAILLMGSILFFMFATAARPHIHVTFWMLLSLDFSIQLSKKYTWKNILGAFGAAVCAFCTLQNGIFVFVFPIWAYMQKRNSKEGIVHLIGILGICAIASLFIGYPYLLHISEVNNVSTLGHSATYTWNGAGFKQLLNAALGSEIILSSLCISTAFLYWKKKIRLPKSIQPIIIFLALYCLVFSIYGNTQIRFFIILTPLLALLAVPTMSYIPKWSQNIVWILIIIIQTKFFTLSLQPNTYQVAISQLQEVGGGVVIDVPYAALGIPVERKVNKNNHEQAIFYLALESANVPDIWTPCVDIHASNDRNRGTLFLWNDVPWAWYYLMHTKRLGPNVTIHCKKEAMDAQA